MPQRGRNYSRLKLLGQVLKAIEVLALIIRGQIIINSLHFSFIPGRRINYKMKYISKKKKNLLQKSAQKKCLILYLLKFYLRWAIRTLGVQEWIILTVAAFCEFGSSKVCVNGKFSEEFAVKFGVHQGSVLDLLLFITTRGSLQNLQNSQPMRAIVC